MDNQQNQIILSVLKKILGNPRKERQGQEEYEFNCISDICKHDRDKYNIWYNIKNNIFRCWKCKSRGTIYTLIEKHGTEEDLEKIKLIIPKFDRKKIEFFKKEECKKFRNVILKYPYGFKKLIYENKKSDLYNKSIEYLTKRRITKDLIEKYNLGYVEEGFWKGRIIIPSYNEYNNLNYFVGRSFLKEIIPNYMGISKEIIPKDQIIFNEINVNFDIPVYLVEGVFDMFPIANSIPMLGKYPSEILIDKILKHKTKIILCLDEDAIKDSIELYNKFLSFGIDVYFIEIKDDIGKYYEIYGKDKLIELLKNHKKITFDYLMELSFKDKELNKNIYPENFLEEEWNNLKNLFEKFNN